MVFLQANRRLGDVHFDRIRWVKGLFPNAEIQLLLENAQPGYYDVQLATRFDYVLPQGISLASSDLIFAALN